MFGFSNFRVPQDLSITVHIMRYYFKPFTVFKEIGPWSLIPLGGWAPWRLLGLTFGSKLKLTMSSKTMVGIGEMSFSKEEI